MNGYVCFWKQKRIEVFADSSYGAQLAAIPIFQAAAGRKKVKGHDISVILAERDGVQVVHSPTM